MISSQSGNKAAFPRLLIHKEDGAAPAPAPVTFCEYADGADDLGGLVAVPLVSSLGLALAQTANDPLPWGSAERETASSVQPPNTGPVTEIEVPAGSNGTAPAFYDVAATFTFGQPE